MCIDCFKGLRKNQFRSSIFQKMTFPTEALKFLCLVCYRKCHIIMYNSTILHFLKKMCPAQLPTTVLCIVWYDSLIFNAGLIASLLKNGKSKHWEKYNSIKLHTAAFTQFCHNAIFQIMLILIEMTRFHLLNLNITLLLIKPCDFFWISLVTYIQ